jgi:hypothetical protein
MIPNFWQSYEKGRKETREKTKKFKFQKQNTQNAQIFELNQVKSDYKITTFNRKHVYLQHQFANLKVYVSTNSRRTEEEIRRGQRQDSGADGQEDGQDD